MFNHVKLGKRDKKYWCWGDVVVGISGKFDAEKDLSFESASLSFDPKTRSGFSHGVEDLFNVDTTIPYASASDWYTDLGDPY